MIERKTARLSEVKTATDGSGYFKARVAVFGNVDDGGDRIVKGAFAADIAAKNGIYPVVWSHDWQTPPIGVTKSAVETDEGLEIEGELFIDSHPVAAQVYEAFKRGAPLEFSFAYDITDFAHVKEGNQEIRELRGLVNHEVGPTLIGMNRETQLLAVKGQVALAKQTLAALAPQDLASIVAALKAGGDEPTSPADPADDPSAPDPADAGSSDNPDDLQPKEPGLTPAQAAEAVRYLATPVG